MDYLPPKLPPEPPNTFVNLPTTPEKGPLYVLLYDLVNMDNPNLHGSRPSNDFSIQMFARQQMLSSSRASPRVRALPSSSGRTACISSRVLPLTKRNYWPPSILMFQSPPFPKSS